MEESLEDRLKSHAQAFDGLLSLIPAKFYYEDDKSEQWQRKKKQTKDQAKAAKLAKLNPDNARSARDVLDEREEKSSGIGKRKRANDSDEGETHIGDEGSSGADQEKPMEGLKRKKVKIDSTSTANASNQATSEEVKANLKRSKAIEKAERMQLKAERRKEKLKEKSQAKQAKAETKKAVNSKRSTNITVEADLEESDDGNEIVDFDAAGLADLSPTSPSSKAPSPSFDIPNNVSGTSSISSIATQNASNTKGPKPKSSDPEPPSVSQAELRARLQARIAELRNARKADGDEDRPARSRTELIEQRRKKEEQKKAAKKALRAQAKEDERRKRDEALARGSPLMTPLGNMSPAQVASPSSESHSFSFSRVAFDNGQTMSPNLTSVLNPQKKATTKISKDTLENLEKRQDRLSNMSPEKRASAEEKDMWLNAKNRAQGLRIKDDTSLLKKALKRKDNKKKKGTKEWDNRIAGVAQAQAAKQKRREENLAKRKEEKGSKGSKGRKTSGKGQKKTKARPGFEGSFKTGGGMRK